MFPDWIPVSNGPAVRLHNEPTWQDDVSPLYLQTEYLSLAD